MVVKKSVVYFLSIIATSILLLSIVATACTSPSSTPSPTPTPTPSPTPTPQKVTWKAAHYVDSKTPYHIGLEYFAEQLKKRTNGGITIEIFPNASLVSSRDMLQSTSTGLIDLGFESFAFNAGELPFNSDGQFLPFAYNWQTMSKLLEAIKPIYQKEIDKYNQSLLIPQPSVIVIWVLKKPLDDINNPDFKKQRISLPGGAPAKVGELFNATVVNIPVSELQSALRTGVIDGTSTSWTTYVNYQLIAEAPYVVDLGPGGAWTGIWWTVNKDSFNKLPAEWKTIVLDEGKKAGDYYLNMLQGATEKDIQTAKSSGAKVTTLTEAQAKVWKAKCQPIYDGFITKHGEPMRQFIDLVLKTTGM